VPGRHRHERKLAVASLRLSRPPMR
jgi:hypothetical protein